MIINIEVEGLLKLFWLGYIEPSLLFNSYDLPGCHLYPHLVGKGRTVPVILN